MAAATELTWNGPGSDDPRRPSVDDLGGDQKQDNAEYPPNEVEHYTAAGWNQLVDQVAALAKVAASCKLEVRFSGGTPSVVRVSCPGTNITTATFTVTDNGTGDTTVEWPANTFPPHACSPTGLTLISSAIGDAFSGHVSEVTNGIRVQTFENPDTQTDVDWTIEIN